jgi:hypothetical protein
VRLTELDRPTARAWALKQPKGNVHVVRAMFGDAVRGGLAATNPFSNLRLEQSRGRKDLEPLTEAELHDLVECTLWVHGSYGPTFRAMILFAAYVGIRASSSRWSTRTSSSTWRSRFGARGLVPLGAAFV